MEPYGHFRDDGEEFVITRADIPRNWYNYLWNDRYISFISQTGMGDGFFQDPLGRRLPLLRDRCAFILEGDAHWGVSGLPVEEQRDTYSCTHGLGYTVIHTEKNGIATDLTVCVPDGVNGELWQLRIRNRSETPRRVRALVYGGTDIDGAYVRQGYNTDEAVYDERLHCLRVKAYKDLFGQVNHPYHAYMAVSEKPDGYDGAANAFIGPYGALAYPKAVARGHLTNTGGNGEKLGFSFEKQLELEPHGEAALVFLCAIDFSEEEMERHIACYRQPGSFERELEAVRQKFRTQIGAVTVETPDAQLNHLFVWLKHQANMGSRWARVRHNGFRDMTSDCECLASVDPELAFERFKRVLTFQYANGYAPRTVKDGKICDNNFADNAVWIPFAAHNLLMELGRTDILGASVPFNDGSAGTVYEHVSRAVDYLYHFRSTHELIKIWGGDWNDCMNYAGLQGKGVSVWLSLAWLRANDLFAEIAALYGQDGDAALAKSRSREMRSRIAQHGWDGEYYLCAYNDAGEPIGSHTCEEGRMFLIPQLWAVFSHASDGEREATAMDSVEKYLSSPLGTVICTPPYTRYNAAIGAVTKKAPGIHENGGVYLHTIAWKIIADAMLKRADRVEQDLETILPFRNPVVNGRAEPYVLCNSYFGIQTGYRYGTPGQSWRTAAGPCLERALLQYVYGLMPEMEGLRVSPCLPPSWKSCRVTKEFRGAVYDIRYENGGVDVSEITVNGAPLCGDRLPYRRGARFSVVVKTK